MAEQLLSDELFRIDYNRDTSEGAWVRATEALVSLGVLVPVEIDYEAAIAEWARAHDGFEQGIRDIIDAALGIEGGDDA
jgi:hypothetical protein